MSSRFVRWLEVATVSKPGYLLMTIDGHEQVYKITLWAGKSGTIYEIRKGLDEAYYEARLAPRNNCTCPGHVKHGHCKHVDALRALWQRKQLPYHK